MSKTRWTPPQLSPALPFTVKSALLTFIPAFTLVMLNVGLVTSIKLACSIKFDSTKNRTVVLLVTTLKGKLVPPVQLANVKPLAAFAVIE